MNPTLLIAFATSWFLLSLTPGPGVLCTISHSINCGKSRTVLNILGQEAGLLSHFSLVSFGVGAVLARSTWTLQVLKWFGAAYLLYLAYTLLMSASDTAQSDTKLDSCSNVVLFRRGFAVNFTNPKSFIFVFAFLPQFVDLKYPALPQYLTLTVTAILLNSIAMALYLFGSNSLSALFLNKRYTKHVNRFLSALFALFAVLAVKG